MLKLIIVEHETVLDFLIVGGIDIREGFPKLMRVSPEGLALF